MGSVQAWSVVSNIHCRWRAERCVSSPFHREIFFYSIWGFTAIIIVLRAQSHRGRELDAYVRAWLHVGLMYIMAIYEADVCVCVCIHIHTYVHTYIQITYTYIYGYISIYMMYGVSSLYTYERSWNIYAQSHNIRPFCVPLVSLSHEQKICGK